MRGNSANYKYDVPGQWQGQFESLRVIGDKRGGAVSLCLIEHPDFLERVRANTGVPLRLIHVVRNPYDNIASISIWHRMSLQDSADFYFRYCAGISMLEYVADSEEIMSIHHEDMVGTPRRILTALCAYLGLDVYPGYIDDCRAVLFDKPTFTRRKVVWEGKLIDDVAKRASALPFLKDYRFELGSLELGPDQQL